LAGLDAARVREAVRRVETRRARAGRPSRGTGLVASPALRGCSARPAVARATERGWFPPWSRTDARRRANHGDNRGEKGGGRCHRPITIESPS
jgi:hypothetical protein